MIRLDPIFGLAFCVFFEIIYTVFIDWRVDVAEKNTEERYDTLCTYIVDLRKEVKELKEEIEVLKGKEGD